MPLRGNGHALHRQHAQVGFQLAVAQGMPGQHGQPEAARHGFLDGLVAAQFQPRGCLEALGREETVRGQPGAGAALAQHEALVAQVRQGDATAPRQAMALPGHEHQRVGEKDMVFQVQIRRGHGHDVEIVQVLAQALHHAVAVEHLQRDLDVRVLGAKAAQQARHEILGRADHGHAQAPAREAVHGVDPLAEVLPRIDDGACRGGQVAAGIGEVHAAPDHLVQRQAHGFGHLAQLHGRGGLRHMQGPRRAADAARIGQRQEQAHLAEGDIHR